MKRNIYLNTVTLEEAIRCFEEKAASKSIHQCEEISIVDAYGRVTAEPVFALYSNPNFNAAAMDGIAVRYEATVLADERRPCQLKLNRDFIYVDTGDLIVFPYDSVIMIEDVLVLDDQTVEIRKSSHKWEHVRMIGEDFVLGEMLLTRHHSISAVDLGALVSGGVQTVKVYKPLKVGLIPTGTEIVELGTTLKPGDIIESNSHMFSGLVKECGAIPVRYPIVPDDKILLKEALLKAVSENDIVIINAGSSAGSEDYTSSLIAELGDVWVHGIDIKPGKPTILGEINQTPVIGIPGYPVSAYMTFKHFVMPLLDVTQTYTRTLEAVLSQAIPSSLKHKEFVRVQLGYVDQKWIATPLKRGAASTMSLVKANGILTIDKASEGYVAGSQVSVALTRLHLNPRNGLVSIGSHDIIMDVISDLMLEEKYETHLISAHTGSLGGILAIKRGEAHVAPIHLLDEETGTYNMKAVEKYLSNEPCVLIRGIKRWQGFYMRPDEQMVEHFKDIESRHLTFVNRQNGSGTRYLTDYLMKVAGVRPDHVLGYETEVLTHTAVASAILGGNADVGMGIESVARQMGLAYQKVAIESYDFLVPVKYLKEKVVEDFIDVLKSPTFRKKLSEFEGYELEQIEMIAIGGTALDR